MGSTMDAECAEAHRERRGSRLCVVVAAQSVVVALCCAVSLYLYWQQTQIQGVIEQDDIYIEFDTFSGSSFANGDTIKFGTSYSSHRVDANGDKIKVHCRGPYVLYMEVCVKTFEMGKPANGTIKVSVEGSETSDLASFPLQANKENCRSFLTTVYLKLEENVIFRLNSEKNLKIQNVSLSLHYLLQRCLPQ